jgi:Holliday junction resolvase RusA-like endonuclease
METINIKPLSVNQAWQGRRFKTPKYKHYESSVLFMMPKMILPDPPFRVEIEVGFSNKASDIDNPVKMILDIMQKKYNFNDSEVYELSVKKVIVKKQKEYFKYTIKNIRQ